MQSRKDFIRNTLLAFAATLLPKPLLPQDPKYFIGVDPYDKRGSSGGKAIIFIKGSKTSDGTYVATYGSAEYYFLENNPHKL